jgi:hypothetical protein
VALRPRLSPGVPLSRMFGLRYGVVQKSSRAIGVVSEAYGRDHPALSLGIGGILHLVQTVCGE